MPQQGNSTSRQSLIRLQLVHGAQISALLIFSLIAFLMRPVDVVNKSLSELFIYTLGLLFALALTVAHFVFKRMSDNAANQSGLKPKMANYTTACIIRAALFEVPGLFAAVVVLVTGNVLALTGSLMALLLLLFFRPSTQQVVQDLNLTNQEKIMLESSEKNI